MNGFVAFLLILAIVPGVLSAVERKECSHHSLLVCGGRGFRLSFLMAGILGIVAPLVRGMDRLFILFLKTHDFRFDPPQTLSEKWTSSLEFRPPSFRFPRHHH